MISAMKAMKLIGGIPPLEAKHNALMKTPEKLIILLLLSFFGCKDVSHLPHSGASDWFSAETTACFVYGGLPRPCLSVVFEARLNKKRRSALIGTPQSLQSLSDSFLDVLYLQL